MHEARRPRAGSEKSRWLLLRREHNLKDEQRFRLGDLLRYNLKTVRAYLLKEAFSATLGLQLARVGREVPRRMVSPDDTLPHRADEEDRSVAPHASGADPELLPSSEMLSSGVFEGLNNKANVTMRKAYGFRTLRVLELALYHSPAKLPEPERPTILSDEPES